MALNDELTRYKGLNSLWNQNKSGPKSTYEKYMGEMPTAQNNYTQEHFRDKTRGRTQQMRNEVMAATMSMNQGKPQASGESGPPISGSGSGIAAIAAGQKYIGKSKYVWGGGRNEQDIKNGNFDCSGFVNYAFKQAGIDLGSGNTDTIVQKGKAVNPSDMRPGDIVFFDTYKKNGHVGIYVGNGKFLGSQSKNGVSYADMSKGYFKEKFSGVVRRV